MGDHHHGRAVVGRPVSSAMISAPVAESRLPVGSSANTTAGGRPRPGRWPPAAARRRTTGRAGAEPVPPSPTRSSAAPPAAAARLAGRRGTAGRARRSDRVQVIEQEELLEHEAEAGPADRGQRRRRTGRRRPRRRPARCPALAVPACRGCAAGWTCPSRTARAMAGRSPGRKCSVHAGQRRYRRGARVRLAHAGEVRAPARVTGPRGLPLAGHGAAPRRQPGPHPAP